MQHLHEFKSLANEAECLECGKTIFRATRDGDVKICAGMTGAGGIQLHLEHRRLNGAGEPYYEVKRNPDGTLSGWNSLPPLEAGG